MTIENPEKHKILLVDDEPLNIQVLHGILANKNYEFIFATGGKEALEHADQQQPDIILLDVMMPDMDGYEVCRQLKENPLTKNIPVIFVTALSQTEDEEKGLLLGAIDYISKPLSAPIVRVRLKNHIDLKIYRDRLNNMAMLDGLTGIANRRRFDEFLVVEWNRAKRNKTPISLILMDIDFFKPYNDNYGHAAGDTCLKLISKLLAEAIGRPTDLVARYGGEEFVCVLPETGANGALKMAENILASIRSARIPHEFSTVTDFVTLSLGCLTVEIAQNTPPHEIIEEADKLLYRSKEGGRNRVTTRVINL